MWSEEFVPEVTTEFHNNEQINEIPLNLTHRYYIYRQMVDQHISSSKRQLLGYDLVPTH